jgi:hypothetical protein
VKTLLAVALACGLSTLGQASAQASARSGDYSVQVLSESGRVLPTFLQDGHSYAMGTLGHRYSLRVRNGSDRRVEFVASVDGRDVLEGQSSSWDKRGYLVNPHSEVIIDGFRLSHEAVAAFRFSSLHSSYASRMDDARDVGVIGVAVFPERGELPVAQPERPHFWNNVWGSRSKREGGVAVEDKAPQPTGAEQGMEANKAALQEAQAAADEAPAPAGPTPATESAPTAPPATPAPALLSADSAPNFRASGALGKGAGMSAVAQPARAHAAMREASVAQQQPAKKSVERPGLGTEFGERRYSQADEVEFERASSRPAAVLSLHYDNREGLIAMGIDVDRRLELAREARLRHNAEPFRRNAPLYDRSPALLAR